MKYGEHPIQKGLRTREQLVWTNSQNNFVYHPLLWNEPVFRLYYNKGMLPVKTYQFGDNERRKYYTEYWSYGTNSICEIYAHDRTGFPNKIDIEAGDTIPFYMALSPRSMVIQWHGTGTNKQRGNAGPNHIKHVWNTNTTIYSWIDSLDKTRNSVRHNPNGPAKVTNCKTAHYYLNGELMTLTEYKKRYLMTHLTEFKNPDLQELCNR